MFTEYGIGPDEINEYWTEERIALYLRKRNERIERWNAAAQSTAEPQAQPQTRRRVTDMELFQTMGIHAC